MNKPGMRAVPVTKNGTPVTKWSRQKLESEMRRAGWVAQGMGTWQHPQATIKVQLFAFEPVARREVWHRYAELNQVPKPEDFR